MIACLLGTIKNITSRTLTIEDLLTKKEYVCEYVDDGILNLTVGTEGVFVGQLIESVFKIKKIDLKKFLEPLYEKELLEASGKYNLVPVLKDPFTETYIEFMEQQKLIEESPEDYSGYASCGCDCEECLDGRCGQGDCECAYR